MRFSKTTNPACEVQALKTSFVNNFNEAVISMKLEELKVKMRSAGLLLKDAELKQVQHQEVKDWVDDLTNLSYDVDRLIDTINTEVLRRKIEDGDRSTSNFSMLSNYFSTQVRKFDNAIKSNIEDILRRLDDLLNQNLGLESNANHTQLAREQRIIAPAIEESGVFGRDGEKKLIIDLLFCDDVESARKVSVIPIVGMSGIGKTTLAQLVYKDKRVQEHFDLKVWVSITEDFDVPRITTDVLKAVKTTFDHTNTFSLQMELKGALCEKRFLFVFDDVWNEDYKSWDSLVSAFESGSSGSTIIVTTRSQKVATMMGTVESLDLYIMEDDDCWELFKKHAFKNAKDMEKLEEIGNEIVKKCKGHPLAVKSIAGLLRSKPDINYWRKIRESDIWDLKFQEDQRNNIPPALWLSYHFLPPQIKRCFVYCSIFPKEYTFYESHIDMVVRLWMAEGLLQPQKGKSMEDVGKAHLDYLISRSFFQLQRDDDGVPILVMHDLVHDLAIRMSGEFCTLLDNCRFDNDLKRKTIHLLFEDRLMNRILESLGKGKYLRTLLLWSSLYDLIEEYMTVLTHRGARYLRMLSLSGSRFTKIPDSIGNLKYLRFLNLSYTKIIEVPIFICTLYNLQTLLLSNCGELKYLPEEMHKLIILRHLDITKTPLQEMPLSLFKMKNLKILISDLLVSTKDGSAIKVLGDVQLHWDKRLGISGLKNVDNAENASKANSTNKVINLESLSLEWDGETNDSAKENEVFNAIQPRNNLKKLSIIGFGGTRFPDWVTAKSFERMVEITVESCINCYFLPPLGHLPSLKSLSISGMNGVASIGDEFCGTNNFQPFRSLEELTIRDMDSLEKWSFTKTVIFPSLKKPIIAFCERLEVGLAADNHFPFLETLEIFDCKCISDKSFRTRD